MCLNCDLWTRDQEYNEFEGKNLPWIVNICGGDPLYSPKIIEVLTKAKKSKRLVCLTNNGLNYLQTEKKIFALIDIPIIYVPGVDRQQLTENTGLDCYRDYLALFELLHEIKKKFVVRYPVNSNSLEFVPDMVQFVRRYPRAVLWLAAADSKNELDPQERKYLWYNDQKKRVVVSECYSENLKNDLCLGCDKELEKINLKNIVFFIKLLIKLYF